MYWYSFPPRGIDAVLAAAPGAWCGAPWEVPARPTPSGAPPTEIDLRLIDLVYGLVAAGTRCARCGAGLRADLRLGPSAPLAAPASGWSVPVLTGALVLELRDEFGPTGEYSYPLPVAVRIYAPDRTSTTTTTSVQEREGTGIVEVLWPGSFVGAPPAYPAGSYTVLWTSDDRVLACGGFTAV